MYLKTLVSVLLFCLAPTTAQTTTTETINSLNVFPSQKPCAQACFFNNGYDVLASVIQCNYAYSTNAPNYCYCRSDLQSVAESYLTSCVKSQCTVGDSSIDISSAGSIYRSYCSSNGYAVNVPATTTHGGARATTTYGGAQATTTYNGTQATTAQDSAQATTTQDSAQATTTQDYTQPTITAYVTTYNYSGASSAGLAYFTVANICVLFSLIASLTISVWNVVVVV